MIGEEKLPGDSLIRMCEPCCAYLGSRPKRGKAIEDISRGKLKRTGGVPNLGRW
jgi:hypothetical protein